MSSYDDDRRVARKGQGPLPSYLQRRRDSDLAHQRRALSRTKRTAEVKAWYTANIRKLRLIAPILAETVKANWQENPLSWHTERAMYAADLLMAGDRHGALAVARTLAGIRPQSLPYHYRHMTMPQTDMAMLAELAKHTLLWALDDLRTVRALPTPKPLDLEHDKGIIAMIGTKEKSE